MRILQLCLTALLFTACEGWNRAPDATVKDLYNHQAFPPNPNTDQQPIPTPNKPLSGAPSQDTCRTRKNIGWGVLKCNKDQEPTFNIQLRRFLSAFMDPKNIPAVQCSGRKDLKGGAFIAGKVEFENGDLFDPCSKSQSLEVAESSYLNLAFSELSRGLKIAEIQTKSVPYTGTVRGNIVSLAFSDIHSKTTVLLNGTVEKGVYSGQFEFKNSITWQGNTPGSNGRAGIFSIYACDLLNCVDAEDVNYP